MRGIDCYLAAAAASLCTAAENGVGTLPPLAAQTPAPLQRSDISLPDVLGPAGSGITSPGSTDLRLAWARWRGGCNAAPAAWLLRGALWRAVGSVHGVQGCLELPAATRLQGRLQPWRHGRHLRGHTLCVSCPGGMAHAEHAPCTLGRATLRPDAARLPASLGITAAECRLQVRAFSQCEWRTPGVLCLTWC